MNHLLGKMNIDNVCCISDRRRKRQERRNESTFRESTLLKLQAGFFILVLILTTSSGIAWGLEAGSNDTNGFVIDTGANDLGDATNTAVGNGTVTSAGGNSTAIGY